MKTIGQIQEEVAKEKGYDSWHHYLKYMKDSVISINVAVVAVAERYAGETLDHVTELIKNLKQ